LQITHTKLTIRYDMRQYYQYLPYFLKINLKVIFLFTFRCSVELQNFFCMSVFYLILVSFPVYFTIPVLNDLLR